MTRLKNELVLMVVILTVFVGSAILVGAWLASVATVYSMLVQP